MILDATCGPKGMWYEKNAEAVVYLDVRKGVFHTHKETLSIDPTILADNGSLPFRDAVFDMVLYDPSFIVRAKSASVRGNHPRFLDMYIRYGDPIDPSRWVKIFFSTTRDLFRVLRSNGFLVFKWNDMDRPLTKVLTLFPYKPLFGNRWRARKTESQYKSATWFIVFRKDPSLAMNW